MFINSNLYEQLFTMFEQVLSKFYLDLPETVAD